MKLSSRALLGSRMAVEVRWGDGIMTGVCMLCCQTSLLLLLSSAREKPKSLFQTTTHTFSFLYILHKLAMQSSIVLAMLILRRIKI